MIRAQLPTFVVSNARYPERHYDLFSWLDRVASANGLPSSHADSVKAWVMNDLIAWYTVHPQQKKALTALCGISIFVPQTTEAFPVYRNHLFDVKSAPGGTRPSSSPLSPGL